ALPILKELNVPLLHCHREVGTIVGPEIEIEPVADERGGSDNALDKLIAPLKLLQHTHILRLADRIIGVAPDASRRSTRLLLRLQKLARAGAVVREGVNTRKTFREHLLLQPDFALPA